MSYGHHSHGRSGRYSSNDFSDKSKPHWTPFEPEVSPSAGSLGPLSESPLYDTLGQNLPDRSMSSFTVSGTYAQGNVSIPCESATYSSHTGALTPRSPLNERGKPKASDNCYAGQATGDDYEIVVVDRIKGPTVSDCNSHPLLEGHRRPQMPDDLPDQPQTRSGRRESATFNGMGGHLDPRCQRRHDSDCTFDSDPLIFGNSASGAHGYSSTLSMSPEPIHSPLSDSLVMNLGSAPGSIDDYTDGRQGPRPQAAQSQNINSALPPTHHQIHAFNPRAVTYYQSSSTSLQRGQAGVSRHNNVSASAPRSAYTTDQSQMPWEWTPLPNSTSPNTNYTFASYPAGTSVFTQAHQENIHGHPLRYDVGSGGDWDNSSAWHSDYASSPPRR